MCGLITRPEGDCGVGAAACKTLHADVRAELEGSATTPLARGAGIPAVRKDKRARPVDSTPSHLAKLSDLLPATRAKSACIDIGVGS